MIVANGRATQTAAIARAMQAKTHKARPLPRQVDPRLLEGEYARHLLAFVSPRITAAFADLEAELPRLLASAALERFDALRLDAGEGKRVRELVKQAREKMRGSILTPELEKLAEEFARKTSTFQRMQLGRQVKAALGVDIFTGDARIAPLMEAFVDANVGLITKTTDDVAGRIESNVLRAVQDGKPWDVFRGELMEDFGYGRARAELIARDQIGKFYGQANAARQREMGVTQFIWRTSGDERVRDEHDEIDGDTFSYDEGGHPTEGLPGEAIQCRCSAEPDFSTILDALEPEPSAPNEEETSALRDSLGWGFDRERDVSTPQGEFTERMLKRGSSRRVAVVQTKLRK